MRLVYAYIFIAGFELPTWWYFATAFVWVSGPMYTSIPEKIWNLLYRWFDNIETNRRGKELRASQEKQQ